MLATTVAIAECRGLSSQFISKKGKPPTLETTLAEIGTALRDPHSPENRERLRDVLLRGPAIVAARVATSIAERRLDGFEDVLHQVFERFQRDPVKTDPHFAERTGGDPQERLIVAAIAQIEKHGLGQLTVRGVAAAAGVNIAAVNYYFRSKDALVAAALEGTIRNMVADSDDFLARMPGDPEGVLGELLGYYLEGALRYPRISRAHLHDAFVADDYSGPFANLFAPVMQRLRRAIREAVPLLDDQQAARRVVAALSAVFFPAFFAEFYRPLGAFESAAERASYLKEVARAALAPPEPPHRARSKGR